MNEFELRLNQLPVIDPDSELLEQTIYSEEEKQNRKERFKQIWEKGWHDKPGGQSAFQVPYGESHFEQYSSRGWKVHIAFAKGQEQQIAECLYEHGLYFKVEGNMGTYFMGNKESGATIYIGSYDNMQKVTQLIEEKLGNLLTDGAVVKVGEKKARQGSGSDIEIRPKITARFDVARTQYGWIEGNKKYSEYGLPSWTGFGGISLLQKYASQIAHLESHWKEYTTGQRNLLLRNAYGESREELVKDFGQAFLLGKADTTKFK